MKTEQLMRVTCITERSRTPLILKRLKELKINEAFLQRGKQICISESSGFLGMFHRSSSIEERSDIIRFYIPASILDATAAEIIMTADLQIPGRGSLFAEEAFITSEKGSEFQTESQNQDNRPDQEIYENSSLPLWQDYSVLTCIVQRGQSNDIIRTMLDMGLCVPVVSFGRGMGLRNRLGLLRITIKEEKEILYLIVPADDALMVEEIAVHKARIDKPGNGFIYRTGLRASVVNSRVRMTGRKHVASMEQLIAAVDTLQGSTNWRRLSAKKILKDNPQRSRLSCVSVVCDEGRVAEFVQAALDAGADGATFVQLSQQELYNIDSHGKTQAADNLFHAREACDLIVPSEMTENLLEIFNSKGLFDGSMNGFADVTAIDKAITYRS